MMTKKTIKVTYDGPNDLSVDNAIIGAMESIGAVVWDKYYDLTSNQRDIYFDLLVDD